MAPAAAVAAVTLLASAVQGAPTTTSYCAQDGWTQVWADEFDGPDLDTTTWDVHLQGNKSRTRDAMGTADNVYIEDGSLVLRSQRQTVGIYQFTSGAVESKMKRSWTGPVRVCVRAKLPGGGGGGRGDGIWPAHWLMPDNTKCWPTNGEIDFMEMINGDGKLRWAYHWKEDDTCGNPHLALSGHTAIGADWATEFHEYAVEFSDTHITYALDGKPYKTLTVASKTKKGEHVKFYPVPYYIILNTAIGGPWPKKPTAKTTFPNYHYIDYVRVSETIGDVATCVA